MDKNTDRKRPPHGYAAAMSNCDKIISNFTAMGQHLFKAGASSDLIDFASSGRRSVEKAKLSIAAALREEEGVPYAPEED